MKAGVFNPNGKIKIEEKEIPVPSSEEVLIKVKACGVCMTDVYISKGELGLSEPVVLGHEFSGVIKEVGEKVSDFREGDRVAVNPTVSCGKCTFCQKGRTNLCPSAISLGGAAKMVRDGGFQEYALVPQENLGLLDSDTSFLEGTFVEPLGCAIHGVERTDISIGDEVLLIGAGPMGLLLLQLLVSRGAAKVLVSELKSERRRLAKNLGATLVINPRDTNLIEKINQTGLGVNLAIEAVGKTDTIAEALKCISRGGKLEIFGVPPKNSTISLNIFSTYFDEIEIIGSYAITKKSFRQSLSLLNSHRIKTEALVSHEIPLRDLVKAIEMTEKSEGLKKVVRIA